MRRAMTLCFEPKCFSLYYFPVRERILIDPLAWICIRRIASWSQSQLQNALIIILMTGGQQEWKVEVEMEILG